MEENVLESGPVVPGWEWLARLDVEDLDDLLFAANRALAEAEDVGRGDVWEAALVEKFDSFKDAYRAEMLAAVKALEDGSMDFQAYMEQVHDIISEGFRGTYEAQLGRELGEGDEEWLRRAIDEELGHARKMGMSVISEEGSRAPIEDRAEAYSRTLDGIGWHAWVESLPDDARIDWRLGCLTSNLLSVNTERGRISLVDVVVGDMVLTHQGRWRKVLAKPVRISDVPRSCAVLIAQERLIGLTDDHRLWTSSGWKTAREVTNGKDRCLSERGLLEMREEMRSSEESLPKVLQQESGGKSKKSQECLQVCEFDFGEFHGQGQERADGCELLERPEMVSCNAGALDLEKGERPDSGRSYYSSQERKSFRRQVGELGSDCSRGAQQDSSYGCEIGEGKPELEGREAFQEVRAMREDVPVLRLQEGREVLLPRMSLEGDKSEEGVCPSQVRELWEGVCSPEEIQDGKVEEGPSGKLLLSGMLHEAQVRGDFEEDLVLRIMWKEYRSGRLQDQEVEVGQVLLLDEMLPCGHLLYDLTIEEDCSFIVEGMVVHNSAEHCPSCLILASNSPYGKYDLPTTPRAGSTECLSHCLCKLVVRTGRLTAEERQDAEEFAARREESLAEMLANAPPPEGQREPDEREQAYIQDLRSRINYNRREMAQLEPDTEEWKAAMFARKEANAELIEFTERNGIHEVPIWSVDEVLDGRHIGRRAVHDVFRSGIDGRSLDKVGKKKLTSILDWFESKSDEPLWPESW